MNLQEATSIIEEYIKFIKSTDTPRIAIFMEALEVVLKKVKEG